MARLKFRLFHLILEICTYSNALLRSCGQLGMYLFRILSRNFWENSSTVPSLLLICMHNAVISVLGIGYPSSVGHHAVFLFCVSDAHNFTANPSSVYDYGYRAFAELARFTFCLLQKIKSAQSLPLVEKWEDFRLPNHSRFPSVLLRRKSSWREVGLTMHSRRWALSTFAMSSGWMPGKF